MSSFLHVECKNTLRLLTVAHVHTLSGREFALFAFHFHRSERAGIGIYRNNDWLSVIKGRRVNLTGRSLNYGTVKWQHIT